MQVMYEAVCGRWAQPDIASIFRPWPAPTPGTTCNAVSTASRHLSVGSRRSLTIRHSGGVAIHRFRVCNNGWGNQAVRQGSAKYWHTFPADIQDVPGRCQLASAQCPSSQYAERRLAGMARILAHYPGTSLLDALSRSVTRAADSATRPARTLGHALARQLDIPTLSYWTRRAHLGGHLSKGQRPSGHSGLAPSWSMDAAHFNAVRSAQR